MDFISELKWRNLFKDCTDEAALQERLKQPITLYCGFDPTADSLHIGHLQQIILLLRYQQQGHHAIALIGGATGMIGDPRPTTERQLLSAQDVLRNANCLTEQLKNIVNQGQLTVLNNYDWIGQLSLLDFLRDYGKYFNIATMLTKDTIAKRIETGLSFTEFTYTILQAIDFMYLNEHHNTQLQIGGSDQWGNLISGTELIRKIHQDNRKVFGVTSPLITKSDGTKFGKSEGKNIWLNPDKTDSYSFYQYLLNVSDDDVEDFLKRLSLKTPDEIIEIMKNHQEAPHLRTAQKALAEELTLLVFKQEGLDTALKMTNALFNGDITSLNASQLEKVFSDSQLFVLNQDTNLIDALVENKCISSKREARQLIDGKSIQVNGHKVEDYDFELKKETAIDSSISVVKKGKKTYYIFKHI